MEELEITYQQANDLVEKYIEASGLEINIYCI